MTASIASLFVREEELPDEAAKREFEARALTLLTELGQRIQAIKTRLAASPAQSRENETEAPSGYRGSVKSQPRTSRPTAQWTSNERQGAGE